MKKNILLKKTLVFGILALFLGLSVLPSTGMILEYSSVDGFLGDILYVGGNGPGNYTKIQDAIDNANEGDTVFVYDDSSPYKENIFINISIKLIGEDKSTTIIDADFNGHVMLINSPEVDVTGFTLKNSGGSIPGCAGIRINSDNNNIYENIFTDNYYGMKFFSSSYNNIVSNIILENDFFGIELSDSDYNYIHENEVIDNDNIGIVLFSCDNNNISRNDIISNGRGIDLYRSSYNEIYCNNVDDNGCGIYLGSSHGSTCYNVVNKNVAINNSYSGIALEGKNDGIISYNVVTENIVEDNGMGIDLFSYTTENEIYHNNIINNVFYDVMYNGRDYGENIWDNGEEGNYWSDYQEKYPNAHRSLIRPWVWNKPYELYPDGYNKDRYPLVKEWPEPVSKDIPGNHPNIFQFRFLNRFFDWFPNAFPVIRFLLGRVGIHE